jgi:fumarate hydratase class II
MKGIKTLKDEDVRKETDSLGEVAVPSDKLWGRKRSDRSNISASGRI